MELPHRVRNFLETAAQTHPQPELIHDAINTGKIHGVVRRLLAQQVQALKKEVGSHYMAADKLRQQDPPSGIGPSATEFKMRNEMFNADAKGELLRDLKKVLEQS